jgi:ligand-binding sensor domain-containing protein
MANRSDNQYSLFYKFMTINRFLFQVFLILSLSWVNQTKAQSTFLVKHYTMQEYHAGSQNWSIEADDHGFVYVANNDGLVIFDGTGWKTYRNPNQTIVRSVYVASDRRIYTGSYEEFGYWKENHDGELTYTTLKPFFTDRSFHNSEVWKIIECKGKIYFQSFSSLFVYDQHTLKALILPGNIIFLLKARERLFVQTVDGTLYEVENDRIVLLEHGEILKGSEIKTILPYQKNSFLIGTTSQGIFLYDGKTIVPWKTEANQKLMEYQINNGLVTGNRLIFGTIVKGLFVLDMQGKIVNHLHDENALQNNTVLSLCSDHNGTLWVGLDKGIDHVYFNNLVDIYQEKGEQLGAVYTAAMVKNLLYIGTNRGIFTYRFDTATGTFTYSGFLKKSQGQVWELKVIDGALFCGHTSGTFIVEGNNLKQISNANGGFCTQKVLSDQGDYLIQSTYSPLVIFEKEGKNWVYSKQVKGYLEPSRFLEVDHLGNVWVSHSVKGLYKLQLSKAFDSIVSLVSYGKKDGFPSDFAIRVFNLGNRVVFTTGLKLFTWDDLHNKIILYEELNQQLEGFESCLRIIKTGDDCYWFLRKNDIALFKIKDNKATKLFYMFLPLFAIQMVDNYENLIPLDDNRLLICLDNGFAMINTSLLKNGFRDQSKLLFRKVCCMDSKGSKQQLDPSQTISEIPHALNTLLFSFVSINSRQLTQLYQYKLNSIDGEWSDWTPVTEVTYTRLPKGDYTFLVRSMTGTGNVTEPIKLHFKVKAAWYSSTVAWIFYILLALGASLLSRYLFRLRVIRHHERLRLEDEAKVRIEKQQADQEIIKLQNEKLQAEISFKNIQLADSTMAIIRKNELLIEIKDELDRQREKLIPGFPHRYFERLLSLINKNISNDNDWKVFEELFDQAHKNFFKRLKTTYPELTQSDLKLCAYLKMNLSSKEIAPLLNISYRGVETRRFRLRRRLSLDSDNNLVEFVLQF